MSEQESTVKITATMTYQKLLEMNDTQIKILTKLENLESLPERIRTVELDLARLRWIEKVAYAGLTASVTAVIGLIFSFFKGA
jgi:hypothetical protein